MGTQQPGRNDSATDLFTVTNRAGTTLDGAITDVTLTIVVDDGSVFPAAGRFKVTIDLEIIDIASRAGNTLTAETRGVEGTSNVLHADEADVDMNYTAGHYETLRDAIIGTQDGHMQRPTSHDSPTPGVIVYGEDPLANFRRFCT